MASKILDAYGRPIELGQLTQELATASIAGVRSPWFFSVSNGLTPERLGEVLAAVDQGNALEYLTLAEEMEERDLHYHAVLGTRKLALSSLELTVEAVSDSAQDVEQADFLTQIFKSKKTKGLISDLTDALGKGYAVCEILWDKSESQWAPREYKWADQRYFLFDRFTGQDLMLRDEKDLALGIPLAPYKFIQHRPKIKCGLPIRGGLARLACVAFMCKGYALKDWLAFAEVFGMPIRVGKYGEQATPQQKATLLSAVTQIGTDAACIIPNNMLIDFVKAETGAGGDKLFHALADWLDSQVSKGVLGQTMTTDNGSSLSQSQVHNEVRHDIRDDDASKIEATLERDLVRPLIDLNFGPRKEGEYPRLHLGEEAPEDLKALSDALTPFVDRGLPVEVTTILEKFGLETPEGTPEGLLLSPKAGGLPGAPPSGPGGDVGKTPAKPGTPPLQGSPKPETIPPKTPPPERTPQQAQRQADDRAWVQAHRTILLDLMRRVVAGETLNAAQQALLANASRDGIDALRDENLRDWARVTQPVLQPIIDAARAATSFEELQQTLKKLEGKLDLTEVVQALATATFEARALGDGGR